MSVAWDAIKAEILAFVEATKVVSPGHVFWAREAQPIAYEDVVELSFSAEQAIGYDDVEDVEVAPGVFAPRITGVREFTLTIRVNSRSQITAARNALEKVRSAFHHPRLVEQLSDAGIAFLATEGLQTFDDVADDRWESIGELDVRLSVLSELFEPDTDSSLGTLEGVGVSVNNEGPIEITEP